MTTKQTIIPRGYRLTLTTWENDADNFKTSTEEGLTEIQVKFWIDVFQKFRSRHSGEDCIGNLYDPSDAEIEKYNRVMAKLLYAHRNAVFSLFNFDPTEVSDDDSALVDRISDVFYHWYLYGEEEFFTRVADRWKVEYVPTEIVLLDVTDAFNGEV